MIDPKDVTDEQIRELHAANLINDWTREVALLDVLGCDGERTFARARCAEILNARAAVSK